MSVHNDNRASQVGEPLSCADYATHARDWTSVRLLIGVTTGPSNKRRREVIRQTWMRWPTVGRSVVVCFVIGRRQVAPAVLAQLDKEAAEHRDILFLPRAADGCVAMVSIGKAFAFWRTASRIALSAPDGLRPEHPVFIAKADDDSLVNIPLLEHALRRVSCLPYVYYGAFAFTGFQPVGFQNCGFAWGGGGSYAKYGCAAGGAHPPYPFALGQLQALSAPLAAALTASHDASEFAAAAEATPTTNANEDSALGFLISHLPNVRVSYVYMGKAWHNLGCYPASGMYRQPIANQTVVVHRLKESATVRYAWAVLGRGEAPDLLACVNAMMTAKEGPVERLRTWCNRCGSAQGRAQYKGSTPFGCSDVMSRGRANLLRASCVRHGMLPA